MQRLGSIIMAVSILSLCGCFAGENWRDVFGDSAEVDKTLMNYARPENGGKLLVSQDNPEHPASTLNNGNIRSADWHKGEGWEYTFDGIYWYGKYFGYGLYGNIESEDYKWRGLRDVGYVPSAMGWVIIEFPGEKLINRVDVYTIDSQKYPAKKYGVNHLMLQYWTPQAKGWQVVPRLGKGKGQQFDSIRNINTGKIGFRFKPVKTSKVRLAVLWTNDTVKESGNYWPNYVTGTIRLIEMEVYGFEKVKGEIPARISEEVKPEELLLTEKTSDEQSIAIETVVRKYEQAYRNRDIAEFMKNISPNYNRKGETYQKLEAKMKKLFEKYEQINFSLGKLKISQNVQEATAEAKYSLQLEKTGDEPVSYSGKLIFKLSSSDGDWQIFCVE